MKNGNLDCCPLAAQIRTDINKVSELQYRFIDNTPSTEKKEQDG